MVRITTSSIVLLPQGHRPTAYHFLSTVDFTSDGTPVGVAAGNLWLVWLATFILQPMEHTNHKFPAATATGVPSEVKSTVQLIAANRQTAYKCLHSEVWNKRIEQ